MAPQQVVSFLGFTLDLGTGLIHLDNDKAKSVVSLAQELQQVQGPDKRERSSMRHHHWPATDGPRCLLSGSLSPISVVRSESWLPAGFLC
jgi:hypothetical protein